MRTTKREDYAIVLMSALAKSEGYISLRKVADNYHLPYAFLKQIANDLLTAGLLESKGGVTGGYRLSRLPQEISWKDIVFAVDGEPKFAACVSRETHTCPAISKCPSARAWKALQSSIMEAMSEIKLSRFIE